MFTLFRGDAEAGVHEITAARTLMTKTFVEFIDSVGEQLRVKLTAQRDAVAPDGNYAN
jgi:hypothetical protein